MDKQILEFINKLEGFKTAIKSLHWDAANMSQHKLMDDIADAVSDFQDQVSEVEQAISGNLALGLLEPIPDKVKAPQECVEAILQAAKDFNQTLAEKGAAYVGMTSDCESFISTMQRNLYLLKFTVKEGRQRVGRKLIEGNNLQRLVDMVCEDVARKLAMVK